MIKHDVQSPNHTIKRFHEYHETLIAKPRSEWSWMEDAAYNALYYWPQDKWPRPRPDADPKRVAIIGKEKSRLFAPWGKRGWELWGLNEAYACPGEAPVEAHTRWFQLHPPRYLKKHYPPGLVDLATEWGRDRGVRLYMDRHYKAYPNSEAYPKKEVEALTPHGRHHTISFDWMVALAILDGFTEIALYGIALFTGSIMNGESLSGRASTEYWCGVAEGRGPTITVHGNSDLFKTVHMAWRRSELQYGWDREPGHDLADGWQDLR